MAASAAPGAELFEEYFKRADLDRDGRISGTEAVAFFQGSNLSKPVLAQVWMHADQNRTGYLGRQEFYNALKLVTVAQRGHELTPDIVKSALFGPAAAKIPAPKINLVSPPAPQFNPVVTPRLSANSLVPPSNQFGTVTPNAPPSLGTGVTQATQNVITNSQTPSVVNYGLVRPSQAGPISTTPQMQRSNLVISGGNLLVSNLPISSTSTVSSGLLSNNSGGGLVAGMPQAPVRNVTPSQSLDGFGLGFTGISAGVSSSPNIQSVQASSVLLPKPVHQAIVSASPVNNSRSMVLSENGFSSDSSFGGDAFSTTQLKSNSSTSNITSINILGSSTTAPGASGTQQSVKPAQPNSMQNKWSHTPSNQLQQTQATANQNQQGNSWMSTGLAAPSVSSGFINSASNQSQLQWPKISQSDIKKYTKVFVDVDKDKDGKITGEQARNLFLSWKLPREVLKQVWDLSDQDSDSMLTLREFCIALYLMERYREGHSLPNVLPNTLMYDETLLRVSTLPSAGFGGPAWQPGFPQQGFAGSVPVMPGAGARPPMQNQVLLQNNGAVQLQPNSRVPSMENYTTNKLGKQNQNTNSKYQETGDAENKVQELENKILDSKEKIEFHRNKMQELVFYKSRCDNRLNEITERASADKREVELLAKKYEEKYKQVGEIASKLAVEESRFRDIQERKTELHNAIIKMEQGGSADGLLQVRVDRIQSDLEELEKAFIERCKHHNLHVKATTSIELPSGWEPGPQEGALVWDENWDKFEDEGFTTAKDVTVEVDAARTRSPKSTSVYELYPIEEENEETNGAKDQINGSAYDHSEDGSTSIRSSPGRSATESPFNMSTSGKHNTSPLAKERHSDQSGAESTVSGDKFSDEAWTFDDTDSVWGFNTNHSQDEDHFMSGDLRPVKVNSSSASSVFGKDKRSFFDDSVPTSPSFNSSSSTLNDRPEEYTFNSFSRFDSLATHDSEFFPQRESFNRFDSFSSNRPETLSRFDSMSSNRPETFSRFDSMSSSKGESFSMFDSMSNKKEPETFSSFDSMSSSAADTSFSRFDSSRRFDSTSTTRPETFSRFDSMSSTRDYGRSRFDSFDDADPFGSTGPFKASGSNSPRRDSDNWRAF